MILPLYIDKNTDEIEIQLEKMEEKYVRCRDDANAQPYTC